MPNYERRPASAVDCEAEPFHRGYSFRYACYIIEFRRKVSREN